MKFYERLREARKMQGLTQKQAAESIGTTERNYQRYESGESEPTLHVLAAMVRVFGVSIDYLAGLTDDPKGGIG